MTDEAAALPNFSAWLPVALLQRSGTIAFVVLLAVVLLLVAVSPNRLSYFDLSTISASGTTLALAGIGETIVVLGGGLDLSPGAVISLVNVVLVTQLGSSALGVGAYTALATVVALGIGAGIGAINGATGQLSAPAVDHRHIGDNVCRAGRGAADPEISRRIGIWRFRKSSGRRCHPRRAAGADSDHCSCSAGLAVSEAVALWNRRFMRSAAMPQRRAQVASTCASSVSSRS